MVRRVLVLAVVASVLYGVADLVFSWNPNLVFGALKRAAIGCGVSCAYTRTHAAG